MEKEAEKNAPQRHNRIRALWSKYAHFDTVLSLLERTGLDKYLLPTLASGLMVTAGIFTQWIQPLGPVGYVVLGLVGFGLGALILTAIELFRKLRADRIASQKAVKVKQPKFKMLLQGGTLSSIGPTRQYAGVNAGVLVWNTGDPTHIVSWTLEVSVGGSIHIGQYTEVGEQGLTDQGKGRKIVDAKDSFHNRRKEVGEEPIDCNVYFIFTADPNDLRREDAVWKISSIDIWGNVSSARYSPSGITSDDLEK